MHLWQTVLALATLCSLLAAPAGAKSISKPMSSKDDQLSQSKQPKHAQSLALSIRSLKEPRQVGDPVPIEFSIENIGKTDYDYLDRSYDRSGRMPEYELIAQFGSDKKVDDPRKEYPIWTMGGLASKAILKPGQSFKKTIALNRWVVLTQPGEYIVTGVYHLENSEVAIRSKPIHLTLAPRTKAELYAYITQLRSQLSQVDGEKFDDVVQRLMFTCNPVILPSLIDAMYTHKNNFWISEALNYYLPKGSVRPAILRACEERGLAPGSTSVVYSLNRPWKPGNDPLSKEEWKRIIVRSLAIDNSICWAEGSLAAQQHPDDAYTDRLVAIAENPKSEGRSQAIFALSLNRTDASVKALKILLNDPLNWVRDTTKLAIKTAYGDRGNSPGRRMLDSDFHPSLRQPE
jgi:hypothetical protein